MIFPLTKIVPHYKIIILIQVTGFTCLIIILLQNFSITILILSEMRTQVQALASQMILF